MTTTSATVPIASAVPPTSTAPAASQRLLSLDALRGFDMFIIIGGDAVVYALNKMSALSNNRFVIDLKYELSHCDWAGFRFYDMIFPLFVFMVGVSIVLSLRKTLAQDGRKDAVFRIIRRTILLFLIGIWYNHGLEHVWPDIRILGVLQRIAISYGAAALLFCFFRPKVLAGFCVAFLLGYWAMCQFIPTRDIALEKGALIKVAKERGDADLARQLGAVSRRNNPSSIPDSPVMAGVNDLFYSTTNYVTGNYEKGAALPCHFDFEHLPGHKEEFFWDPECILGFIPSVVTCLLGVFAGLLLANASYTGTQKVLILFGAGVVSMGMGWLWNADFLVSHGLGFPVIKKIWTSSYVMVAGGYSAMLLAFFYWVIDVMKIQFWCHPFVWIGMNPITLYLLDNFLEGFNGVGQRLVGGNIKDYLNAYSQGLGDMVIVMVGLFLAVLLARLMYKKKFFLRL